VAAVAALQRTCGRTLPPPRACPPPPDRCRRRLGLLPQRPASGARCSLNAAAPAAASPSAALSGGPAADEGLPHSAKVEPRGGGGGRGQGGQPSAWDAQQLADHRAQQLQQQQQPDLPSVRPTSAAAGAVRRTRPTGAAVQPRPRLRSTTPRDPPLSSLRAPSSSSALGVTPRSLLPYPVRPGAALRRSPGPPVCGALQGPTIITLWPHAAAARAVQPPPAHFLVHHSGRRAQRWWGSEELLLLLLLLLGGVLRRGRPLCGSHAPPLCAARRPLAGLAPAPTRRSHGPVTAAHGVASSCAATAAGRARALSLRASKLNPVPLAMKNSTGTCSGWAEVLDSNKAPSRVWPFPHSVGQVDLASKLTRNMTRNAPTK